MKLTELPAAELSQTFFSTKNNTASGSEVSTATGQECIGSHLCSVGRIRRILFSIKDVSSSKSNECFSRI